ncbi:hypothetical protein BS78_06G267200 [Paspalum vaginatum]|nr:hypothetical protein BS78_06G267200 [Paspalum vaginatum]
MVGACSSLVTSPLLHHSPVNTTNIDTIASTYPTMTKIFCAVLVSSLLLASLAGASSSSTSSSLGRRHQALVLGRKGRELGELGHHYRQYQSEHMQQPEVVAMEVEKPVETTNAGWRADQGEDAEAGLIYSADYSGVAMHAGSPPTTKPKHQHPKP